VTDESFTSETSEMANLSADRDYMSISSWITYLNPDGLEKCYNVPDALADKPAGGALCWI
jgi:hypothetical protein